MISSYFYYPNKDGAFMATTYIQRAQAHQKISNNLRTPDLLAKHPIVGIAMVVLGCLIFGILAYQVHINGALSQWELSLGNRMHASALNSPSWIQDSMVVGFYIGLHGYVTIGVLLGIYFLYKRFWKELLMVAVVYIGEGALWISLAKLFNRSRPVFDTPIGSDLNYPSFPSGHTMSGVICFGLLAYLLVPKISSRLGKTVVIGIAVLLMLFIGFSRFFMGAHHFTDVIAGFAAGIAWSGFVFTLIEWLFKKGEHRNVKET
jgi:membrane-associated phospholipid phosphatase